MDLGFDYLLDQMNNELNEVDLKGAATKAAAAVKKLPQALRNLYTKMSNVVKGIEGAWWKFGAAICRLKNGKFALFNRDGDKLTGDLQFMKRVKLGKGMVPMYRQQSSKRGTVEGWLQPDGRVAAAKMTHENVPLLYLGPSLFNKNIIDTQVKESVISDVQKAVLEATYIEVMEPKEREQEYAGVRKQTEAEFNIQNLVRNVVQTKPRDIAESVITVSDLEEILDDMASAAIAGAGKQRKLSMLLYGPPGVGKSEIITKFFEQRGFNITLLQIQHVPIETLSGFPVIDLEGKMSGGKAGVKMVVSDILPEAGSKGKHLLFLDEFNAGSEEQMKAAMNLALTGKIGTYNLPEDTVVIAAGNAGEQDRALAVNALDAPTLRRFTYKVRIEADLAEWIKGYAKNDQVIEYEGQKVNTGPILSIITRNLLKWSEEEKDPQAAFQKVMQGFGAEEESGWLDPATWSELDRAIKLRGLREYKQLTDEQKEKLIAVGKEQFKNMSSKTDKDKFALGSRAYIVGVQDEVFKRVAPRILGAGSEELVSEMIANYEAFKKERITPVDVMLNYKEVRDKAKKSTAIDAEVLLREIADEIVDIGSETKLKKFFKEKGFKYYESTKNDPLAQALMNVGQFVKDLDVGAEIITAHFESLAPALELQNQLAIDWKAGLLQLGVERIMEGWKAFTTSIQKQFDDIADEGEKQKFMQLRKANKSYEPIIQAAKRIKDPKVRESFIDTETMNFMMHFSKKAKKRKSVEPEPKKEEMIPGDMLNEMLKLAGVKK